MYWQLLIVGYLIISTAASLIRRHLAVKIPQHNALVYAVFYVVFLYPTGLIIAHLTHGSFRISWLDLVLLLLFSCAFPINNILLYHANKHIGSGVQANLSNLAPLITITAASILLHETLNRHQLVGAILIIIAALVASFIGAMAFPSRHQVKDILRKENIALIGGFGALNTFKGVCFLSALKLSNNASLVATIASFTTILVVVAAYFFLKEKEHLRLKTAAAAIGVTGLVLLR